jgi:uncharacterized protein (DUF433 family)
MRFIKLAFLSFIFLFLLVTGISLFIPSHIRISKAVNMQTDFDSLYRQVSILNNWRNWHSVLKDLPAEEFIFLKDSSLKIKDDYLKITQLKNDEIIVEIKKGEGRPIINGMKITSYLQTDSLTVQWYIDFRLRWYPWEKFRSLFYENIYGVQMEQGLANLKQLMETRRLSIN